MAFQKIIRLPAVTEAIGVSSSTVLRMVKAGTFPAPVRISSNAVGWRVSDINSWIETRPPAEAGS